MTEAASGKLALAIGVSTATSPSWVTFLNSDTAEAIAIGMGIFATFTVILVNLFTIIKKIRSK